MQLTTNRSDIKDNKNSDSKNSKDAKAKNLNASNSKYSSKNSKVLVKKTECDVSADCGMTVKAIQKSAHPDHTSNLARLNKIKGQLSGLEKMIQGQRYCIDILIQFRAVTSGLKVIEASILQKHIRNCLKQAIQSKDNAEMEVKLDEIMKLMLRS